MNGIITRIVNFFFKRNQFNSKVLRAYYKKYRGVTVGKYSYGCFTNLIPSNTTIGNYCSFGPNVRVFNANHGINWASTHPFLYNPTLGVVDEEKVIRTRLEVGHEVWIGANVIILPSVTKIGNGAIIGAGSVVTKNIEPYTINAGVPCKLIKFRFDRHIIEELERKEIFNYSKAQYKRNAKYMFECKNFDKLEIND